jgi:hypothetical protein
MTNTVFPLGPDGIRTKILASLVKISIRTLPQDTPGEGREGGGKSKPQRVQGLTFWKLRGPRPHILKTKVS